MDEKRDLSLIKLNNKLEDINLRIKRAKQLKGQDGPEFFKRNLEDLKKQQAETIINIANQIIKLSEEKRKILTLTLDETNAILERKREYLKRGTGSIDPEYVKHSIVEVENFKALLEKELEKYSLDSEDSEQIEIEPKPLNPQEECRIEAFIKDANQCFAFDEDSDYLVDNDTQLETQMSPI